MQPRVAATLATCDIRSPGTLISHPEFNTMLGAPRQLAPEKANR
jgi:hypothetical protein